MKEALKLALDLAIMHHSDDGYAELRSKVRQLAKEALAQDEQEPVAWRVKVETKLRDGSVAVGYQLRNEKMSAHDEPLYTTPPKRPWVGLTDEKRDEILDIYLTAEGRARAIEAELKELNT